MEFGMVANDTTIQDNPNEIDVSNPRSSSDLQHNPCRLKRTYRKPLWTIAYDETFEIEYMQRCSVNVDNRNYYVLHAILGTSFGEQNLIRLILLTHYRSGIWFKRTLGWNIGPLQFCNTLSFIGLRFTRMNK